jgi:hypothetical protein
MENEMKAKETMSDQSALWGATLAYWDSWGVWLMIAGATLGLFALVASLSSSFILWKVSGLAQSELQFKVSEADARAAEATLKANEADLARLKLEEKLAPRRIKQKDQEFIASQISDNKGQLGGIGSSPRDIESMRLESAIHGALSMAGWNVTRGIPTHTPMWPGGVVVGSTLNPLSIAAASRLAVALNAVGIYAVAMPMMTDDPPESAADLTNLNSRRIFVTIGPKPDADDPLQLK